AESKIHAPAAPYIAEHVTSTLIEPNQMEFNTSTISAVTSGHGCNDNSIPPITQIIDPSNFLSSPVPFFPTGPKYEYRDNNQIQSDVDSTTDDSEYTNNSSSSEYDTDHPRKRPNQNIA